MRGQAHTLEAFTAALLLISGVSFGLQAVAVTPLSASTSNQHIQNQQRLMANDILATAAENGTLEEGVLFWNTTEEAFENTSDQNYYTNGGPPVTFGSLLNETFRDERVAFNLVIYFRENNKTGSQRMVYMGTPSPNSITVSRTLMVYDETNLTAGDEEDLQTAAETGSFYAPDVKPEGQLYNVLEVRMTLWRM